MQTPNPALVCEEFAVVGQFLGMLFSGYCILLAELVSKLNDGNS
jgi:hypothetical protein